MRGLKTVRGGRRYAPPLTTKLIERQNSLEGRPLYPQPTTEFIERHHQRLYYDTADGPAWRSAGPDQAADASTAEQGFLESRLVGLPDLLVIPLLVFLLFAHRPRSANLMGVVSMVACPA